MKLASLILLLAVSGRSAEVKNPDTYTYLTISDADSLDPAWSYDTASHAIMLNLYDTLVAFKPGSIDKLDAVIATKVPSVGNGLMSADGRVYTFPIRKGVKFWDGTPMTPEDVQYSIVRFMLSDRDAGPSSLLLQPVLGYPSTRDEKGKLNENAYKDAMKAVQIKGDNIVVTMPRPFAPLLTIFAQWAPIISKQWAIKHGAWDGTEATWVKFNNPQKQSSPFYENAMGTGPFMFERWDRRSKQFVLGRNDAYWRGPAKLKRVIVKGVNEFSTRKLMLQAGDADSIYATAPEWKQLQNVPGVTIIDNLEAVENNPVAYFTFKVNPVANQFVGSGKLDGDGIPVDFFSDKDVRKGFAYSFDYQGFLRDVRRGKGSQGRGAIPRTLPGYNAKGKIYSLDPAKATEHFKKAMGGKVWENGFRFTLAYNSGNVERENVCQILKRSVEGLNPKFKIDVRPIEWPTFLDSYKSSKLPIFVMGWSADYPDPHNFAFPLLHSKGDFPMTQHYANPEIDKLIDQAIVETDMAKRKELYIKAQALEYEDAPHIVINDTTRFRPQRDWVHGFVHSPVFPGAPWDQYFYPLWKGSGSEGAKQGR